MPSGPQDGRLLGATITPPHPVKVAQAPVTAAPAPPAVQTTPVLSPDSLAQIRAMRQDRGLLPDPLPFTWSPLRFEDAKGKFRLHGPGILQTYENSAHQWVYSPTNIARYVDALYSRWRQGDDSVVPRLIANAHWLRVHARTAVGPSGLPFTVYPWPIGLPQFHISAGFHSGLTAANAMTALYLASVVSGEPGFKTTADNILQGFSTPIDDGGYRDALGHNAAWFEEYSQPFVRPPRVLNGHMIAVIDLRWYANATGNPLAQQLAIIGTNALVRNLHLYNDSPISAYDLELRSQSLPYHHAHVALLKELYLQTGIPLFRKYEMAWARQTL